MAYKALYRKYRPDNFESVVGQEHIVKTLQNAIKNNKVAHAYIFSGPRGTGKTTMAKLLAKALNCTSSDKKPCNNCDNCNDINNGLHPDVIEIDAASNNGVDEVREIVDKVKYLPIEGKYKVYIIDEIHSMTKEAFNALLKTLEEPPEHVVFILATTDIHKVIPTILSRCQRFDFAKIQDKDIAKRIADILELEKIEYDPRVPLEIAKLADGGMRDALSILDQIVSYANNKIELSDIFDVYGMLSNDEIINLLELLANQKSKDALDLIEKYINKGIDIKRLTYDLIICIKDALVYIQTRSASLLDKLNENQAITLSKYYYGDFAIKANDILNEANDNYKYSTNQKLFFELALLKIINLFTSFNNTKVFSNTNVSKEKETINNIEKKEIKEEKVIIKEVPKVVVSDTVVEKPKIIKPEESEVISYTLDEYVNILRHGSKKYKEELISKWQDIKKYINDPNTKYVAQMLSDAKVGAANKDFILLVYDYKMLVHRFAQVNKLNMIHDFMKEFTNDEQEIYIIDKDMFDNATSTFFKLLQARKFPPLTDIPKVPKRNEEVQENPNIKLAKKILGDDLEIK